MFFSFDGVDGVGKSTQMQMLGKWLREQGHDLVLCRDPGSTELGERLREIVLGSGATPIDPRSEMLLYMAARAQLVEEIIQPALDRGQLVLCDRFLLANVVYQGYAGGLDIEQVWSVGQVATGGLRPSITFLLDMPVPAALGRIARAPDRMESRGAAYLEQVRQGFLAEARRREDIVVVNADQPLQQVQAAIREIASRHLNTKHEQA